MSSSGGTHDLGAVGVSTVAGGVKTVALTWSDGCRGATV